jgi:hypothetical protein
MANKKENATKVTTDQQQETGPWEAALDQLKNPMKSTPIKAAWITPVCLFL